MFYLEKDLFDRKMESLSPGLRDRIKQLVEELWRVGPLVSPGPVHDDRALEDVNAELERTKSELAVAQQSYENAKALVEDWRTMAKEAHAELGGLKESAEQRQHQSRIAIEDLDYQRRRADVLDRNLARAKGYIDALLDRTSLERGITMTADPAPTLGFHEEPLPDEPVVRRGGWTVNNDNVATGPVWQTASTLSDPFRRYR